jgi:hypothetical protein
MLFSVFRDLESKNQRCTKCDQYERTLAKLKKENQELQDRYYINTVRFLSILYVIYNTCLVVLDFASLILPGLSHTDHTLYIFGKIKNYKTGIIYPRVTISRQVIG